MPAARPIPILCGMQARGIADVRIVGNHPSLDLVNTVASRGDGVGRDYLVTFEDLVLWASRQGVLGEEDAAALRQAAADEPGRAAAALQRARRLRECLWRIWTAAGGGAAPDGGDLALLSQEVRLAHGARALAWSGGGLGWRWTDRAGLDAVTARVALEAAGLLAGGELHRVRECGGQNCGWLFLDTTRNGTRRWCVAEECGSLARVTRFRARRRAAGKQG